ncbi:hypothetical protein SUDANB25_05691 [Streptomyces sp. SudanB25_2051]
MTTPVPLRVALVNGSFEEPTVTGVEILPDASQTQEARRVPGWLTTAPDHRIELWRSGFNGVPAADGAQFAELNANHVSTLYQDLPTTPGTTLYWRLYHRGRLGLDTMALDIGAPGATVEQRRFTDGTGAWGYYTGTYTVPPGQTMTRFAFRSVSAAGGNQSVGNFLDGVFFGTAPLVVLTKTAVPEGPLEVGDVITYRITARNEGGGAAENLVLTDAVPAGTTYVPGSLRIVDGPNTGPKTDQPGDDQAYVAPQGDRVVFHLGNGATSGQGGSLPDTGTLPGGTTVEYRVTIDEAAAGGRVINTATATYENRLGDTPEPLTATSGEAVTEVRAAADLRVVKSADATTVTVGQTVTYRVTVRNTGPNDATGVTLSDQLPDHLDYVSATATAGSYDPATGRWTVGDLPEGATATLTLRAKATEAGPLTNTATAEANETDPRPGDNTDTVTVCVEEAAPCDPCAGPRPPSPCPPQPCPPPPCGPCGSADIAPDPCNALECTPTGLLVPRVRVTGTSGPAPARIADNRQSVDVVVTPPAAGDCPQDHRVRAYLTPVRGEAAVPVADTDLRPTRVSDTWANTPLQVTLPHPGVYLVLGDIDTQICATVDYGGGTNLWTEVRLVHVQSGAVELGPRQSAQHQFRAAPDTRFQHCTHGPTPLTGLVTVSAAQGSKTVRVQAILRGGGPGDGLDDATLQSSAFQGDRSYLTYVKIAD